MSENEWTLDKILLKPRHALAELATLRAERFVPGQWQCDGCGFTLYQRTLNASDGSVSARDAQPEPSQNCQTTLRRVTWQERVYQAEDMLADAYGQRNKAIASQTPAVNNFIAEAAKLATDVGWQAGKPASELVGQIISVLAAHPDHTDRFLEEGGEVFIDGTFDTAHGSLTYRSQGGDILRPSVLRAQKRKLAMNYPTENMSERTSPASPIKL